MGSRALKSRAEVLGVVVARDAGGVEAFAADRVPGGLADREGECGDGEDAVECGADGQVAERACDPEAAEQRDAGPDGREVAGHALAEQAEGEQAQEDPGDDDREPGRELWSVFDEPDECDDRGDAADANAVGGGLDVVQCAVVHEDAEVVGGFAGRGCADGVAADGSLDGLAPEPEGAARDDRHADGMRSVERAEPGHERARGEQPGAHPGRERGKCDGERDADDLGGAVEAAADNECGGDGERSEAAETPEVVPAVGDAMMTRWGRVPWRAS